VPSINQTGAGIRLPNFCNLGVMLRSLLIANAFVAAAALVRASSIDAFWLELVVLAAFCEPALIVSLAVLCAARRPLHAMGYVPSLAVIATIEVAGVLGRGRAGAELGPGRQLPFTHVASSPCS
jgi:two-component system sensor histidine kinase AlgZ